MPRFHFYRTPGTGKKKLTPGPTRGDIRNRLFAGWKFAEMSYNKHMTSPITLGLLISSTQDPYESAILRGAAHVARASHTRLICFTSGALRSYHGFEAQRNVLYDLVTHKKVNGLIVCGTLAHPVGMKDILKFLTRYKDIPMIGVALQIPGHPYIMVDSYQGIHDVVGHMITRHHFEKIAFLRGPRGPVESDMRFRAYRDALQEHGLPYDEKLVLQGDYTFGSGRRALEKWLRAHKKDLPGFQALVSANDSMALGAAEVLRENGLRIPQDVALTGFDDSLDARFAITPLTTVRQSPYHQGRQAAATLLSYLMGNPIQQETISPVGLVLRHSCGCSHFSGDNSALGDAAGLQDADQIRTQATGRLTQAFRHIPGVPAANWAGEWFDAYQADMARPGREQFLDSLAAAVRNSTEMGIELSVWQNALQGFLGALRPLAPDPLSHARLLDHGCQLLGQEIERLEARKRIEAEYSAYTMREISEALMTAFDLESLLEALGMELPRLHVRACHIVLFEDPRQPAGLARLIYTWNEGQATTLPAEGIRFEATDLLPVESWRDLAYGQMVVEALYSKDDRLGFVIFAIDPEQAGLTNTLRGLLSTSLQGVLLLEQRKQIQARLETLVNQLEASNRELESFAYSVSHDLRAPLRAMIGYASILSSDYETVLDADGQHFLARIREAAWRMGQLVDGLLMFSRVGRQEIKRQPVNVHQLASEIIEELSAGYGRRDIQWQFGNLPECRADFALFRQVLANLLGNAVKYTQGRTPAVIELGSQLEHGKVIYFIRDNGAGFDMKYADKLFGVFQRLHRDDEFEGMGIGLATVQRILNRHGGRIWAKAEVGQGATFYFTV